MHAKVVMGFKMHSGETFPGFENSRSLVSVWNENILLPCPCRGSSFHENDRLSSVAAELHFKSLSRHSSPTEDREGGSIKPSAWFDLQLGD